MDTATPVESQVRLDSVPKSIKNVCKKQVYDGVLIVVRS